MRNASAPSPAAREMMARTNHTIVAYTAPTAMPSPVVASPPKRSNRPDSFG